MINNNDQNTFQVIRGGKLDSFDTSRKEFKYAEITNTRLMGVVWLHIVWKLPDNLLKKNYHQFFYFDSEEYAFDSFESVLGSGDDDELKEVFEISAKMKGGLGGELVEVSLKEAKYLVQEYAQMSEKLGEPLPGNKREYKDLLRPIVELSRKEEEELNKKQCTPITLPFESINYFIMRCTGRDFYAAKLLTKDYVKLDLFKEFPSSTLIQNRIEVLNDHDTGANSKYIDGGDGASFDTVSSFRCSSIIESNDEYYMNVSEIKMSHLKVVEYNRINSFRLSESEVAMNTVQREFVSVFQLADDGEMFIDRTTMLTKNAMITPHDQGRLFMIFNPNNDHVKRQVYNLNADVMGFYFVLDNGQILLTAYNRNNIKKLEYDLLTSFYGSLVTPLGKYQFNESTVFEFITNGFDDFEEFVHMIAIGFGEDDGRDE